MGTVPVWDATLNYEKQTPERQQGIVDFLMAWIERELGT